jgi:hypothetical protein
VKSDKATIDGQSRPVYPAADTDLGYQQFGLTILIEIFGEENALLGGL